MDINELKQTLKSKLGSELAAQISDRPTLTFLRRTTSKISKQYESLPKLYADINSIKLPKAFDGRQAWKGLLTPIQNQGKCGSCWAFASTSCLSDKFNIHSKGKLQVHLSASRLIICDWREESYIYPHPEENREAIEILNAKVFDKSACSGNTLYDAWRYLFVNGSPPTKCMPYNLRNIDKNISDFDKDEFLPLCDDVTGRLFDMCSDYKIDEDTKAEYGTPARFYRCKHFYSIPGTPKDKGSDKNIMYDIYKWGPVSTGMQVYPNFYTYDAVDTVYRWDGVGPQVGGHAVKIVGWGETRAGQKYWIIANSWGPEWGDDGYFKIVRGENHCQIEENVITGTPDFFYPIDYEVPHDFKWTESEISRKIRQKIDRGIDVDGGGIDPFTGYTRRSMYTFPGIDFSPPITLDELPDYKHFVAGRDVSPKIKTITLFFKDDDKVVYISYFILFLILFLITITIYDFYRNK